MSSDSAILEEIARLSGAIAQAKTGGAQSQPLHHHSASTFRGTSSRGIRGRGGYASSSRGRGGFNLNSTVSSTPPILHRNAKWVAPKLGQTQIATSLINSTPSSSTPSTLPIPSTSLNSSNAIASTSNIINPIASSSSSNRGSRGGFKNRSLVLSRGGIQLAIPTTTTPPVTDNTKPKEVVIDGVTFVSDSRGNKLVRKPGTPLSTSTDPLTPRRTSIQGTTYIRTKTGNLISMDFAKKRRDSNEKKEMLAKKERLDRMVGIVKNVQGARDGVNSTMLRGGVRGRGGRGRGIRGRGRGASNAFVRPIPKRVAKLCRFFQKTGQCKNGLTCPYTHDSNKVAICPLSLQNKCPNKSTTCPLSHTSNPNRSPHCTHFPNCKKGISCSYTHVHDLSSKVLVCEEFAKMGWCDKGLNCEKRHAFECPEFSEKGTCSTLGCKLPHILRRRNEEGVEQNRSDDEEEEDQETLEGGELKEGEIDWNAGSVNDKASGNKRRLSEFEDIEGGEVMYKKKKKSKKIKEDLAENSDFVTLFVPLSDEGESESEEEEEEEEEDGIDGEEYEDIDGEEIEMEEEEVIAVNEEEEEEIQTDEEGDEEVAKSIDFSSSLIASGLSIPLSSMEDDEDEEEDDFDPDQLLN